MTACTAQAVSQVDELGLKAEMVVAEMDGAVETGNRMVKDLELRAEGIETSAKTDEEERNASISRLAKKSVADTIANLWPSITPAEIDTIHIGLKGRIDQAINDALASYSTPSGTSLQAGTSPISSTPTLSDGTPLEAGTSARGSSTIDEDTSVSTDLPATTLVPNAESASQPIRSDIEPLLPEVTATPTGPSSENPDEMSETASDLELERERLDLVNRYIRSPGSMVATNLAVLRMVRDVHMAFPARKSPMFPVAKTFKDVAPRMREELTMEEQEVWQKLDAELERHPDPIVGYERCGLVYTGGQTGSQPPEIKVLDWSWFWAQLGKVSVSEDRTLELWMVVQLNSEQSRIGAVELDSSKARSMSSEAWNNRYTSMVTPSGGTGDDLDQLSINFYIKLLEEKEKEPGGEAVE